MDNFDVSQNYNNDELQITVLDDILMSDKAIVSDPCYDRGVRCMLRNVTIKPWVYNVNVVHDDMTHEIIIVHESFKDNLWISDYRDDIGQAWVDSGQAWIFCDTYYPSDADRQAQEDAKMERWDEGYFYWDCCKITLKWYDIYQEWYNKNKLDLHFKLNAAQMKKRQDEWVEHKRDSDKDEDNPYIQASKRIEQKLGGRVHDASDDLLNATLRWYWLPEMQPRPDGTNINRGTIWGKWIVAWWFWWDGSYPVFALREPDGTIVWLKIMFLFEYEEEDE